MIPVPYCTTPEHQPQYVVVGVGHVMCPICRADVPSPRPEGPQHEQVGVGEQVAVREVFGRPRSDG